MDLYSGIASALDFVLNFQFRKNHLIHLTLAFVDQGIPIPILNYIDSICCPFSFTEPTYKQVELPNASNDYGVFRFVAIKSLSTLIR